MIGLLTHQVRLEQKAFWRNPQAASFTFALPVALLLLLGYVETTDPHPAPDRTTFTVAGLLAFGLIAACYGNVAINLTTQREEGVLRRLRATPLPFAHYLAGLIGSTVLVSLALTAAVVGLGIGVLDAPAGPAEVVTTTGVVLVAVYALVPLGVALSAVIRSVDAATPVVNATYLPIAILSSLFFPLDSLPGWLDATLDSLPVAPLAHALNQTLSTGTTPLPVADLGLLAAWDTVGTALAARVFTWEPHRTDHGT